MGSAVRKQWGINMQIIGTDNILAADKNVLDQTENVSDKKAESTIPAEQNKASARQDSASFSNEARSLIEQFQSAQENADKEAEGYEEMIKCLTIASRIIAGDKVPYKDQKFLQEKNPDLFFKANLLKTPKLKPKEHKSVLGEEDEDENNGNEEVSLDNADISVSDSETVSSESSDEGTDLSELS